VLQTIVSACPSFLPVESRLAGDPRHISLPHLRQSLAVQHTVFIPHKNRDTNITMSDFSPELMPLGSCEYDAGSGPMATEIFMSMSEVDKVAPEDTDALNAAQDDDVMHVEESEIMGNVIGDNNDEGGIGEYELQRGGWPVSLTG
jgi:hypothetical protein